VSNADVAVVPRPQLHVAFCHPNACVLNICSTRCRMCYCLVFEYLLSVSAHSIQTLHFLPFSFPSGLPSALPADREWAAR
jgi:hypothetical protein